HLDRLMATNGARASDRLSRARSLAALEEWRSAADEYARALEQSPGDRRSRREYAEVLLMIGQAPRAEAEFTKALEPGGPESTHGAAGPTTAMGMARRPAPLVDAGDSFIQTEWRVCGLFRGNREAEPLSEAAYDVNSPGAPPLA